MSGKIWGHDNRQLLVRTIPQNDRKSLYLASHIGSIDGMELGESETLLEQLITFITLYYAYSLATNEIDNNVSIASPTPR